jgi:hypothetical protein
MVGIDIWRAAAQLIKMFGDDAELTAAQRAHGAIDQGDPEGERVWKQFMAAVRDLQQKKPEGAVH